MAIRLLIYNHDSKLYRYKWRLKNTATDEETSFDYAITITGCRIMAHKKQRRLNRKVKKDLDNPIKDEWLGVS
jgi:Holliday junction resolvase RusA-like endonuclease